MMFHVYVSPRYPNKRMMPYMFPSKCRSCALRAVELFRRQGYVAWIG
jgi:hypothetical protein